MSSDSNTLLLCPTQKVTLKQFAELLGIKRSSLDNQLCIRPGHFPPRNKIAGHKSTFFWRADVEAWFKQHLISGPGELQNQGIKKRGRPTKAQQLFEKTGYLPAGVGDSHPKGVSKTSSRTGRSL